MKILDLFKKKNNNVEKIVKKLSFFEINDWLNEKLKKDKTKENDAIDLIKEKITDFVNELDDKIIILEKFDLDSKKEQERIKNIVGDSRTKYIEEVRILIKNLNDLEESKLSGIIKKLNNILFNFNKKSLKNYEKATYLIGKEMVNIKESLRLFSLNILKIFDENKNITESFKIISGINEKIDAISSIEKILEIIDKDTINLKKETEEKEQRKINLNKNLEEIKVNPVYLENLTKQKNIEILERNLEREISELKQLIDFKRLANFFHMNSRQMNIVKDCRDHFHLNFEKDGGEIIIKLLDGAKLKNNAILEKIKKIRNIIKEITVEKKEVKKDEAKLILSQIEKNNFEIENIKEDIIKFEKRIEKSRNNNKEIIDLLKKELEKLDIELI